MAKRDIVAAILCDTYKKDKPDAGFIQILSFAGEQSQWTDEFLHDMKKFESNKKKKFFITDIIPLTCKELPHYANSLKFKDGAKKQVPVFGDKTGLFKIIFNDGSCIIFAKWFTGGGKSTVIESMFAAEDDTWNKWLTIFRDEKKRRGKPKVGIYRVNRTDFGITYDKIKKVPNNDIMHEQLPKVKDSVNYYFANVPSFMKYNQAGRRSILLYGEQGTGKTSILYHLALEHAKTKCVVFSTDISALASHIMLCEKYGMPTICFHEDAEGVFSQNNSQVKNFLSGIDAKQNKGGTCIVYTTNYPEKMEETIIERPERIDELVYVGPISGQMLEDCVRFYFGDLLPKSMKLTVLPDAMTGAEVKLMVENTLRVCASKQWEINDNAIKFVLYEYRESIKKLHNFTEKNRKTYAKKAAQREEWGFRKDEEENEPILQFTMPGNNGHDK